jgi:RNA polymerase-binding transcription factor DksA
MDMQKHSYFKKRLEDEQKLVETELRDLGVQDPIVPGVWDATPGQIDTSATEPDEIADRFEDLESNEGQMAQIQAHWRDIAHALERLENGSYGTCEVCSEQIEEDRLEANPSARTCKAHMGQEGRNA